MVIPPAEGKIAKIEKHGTSVVKGRSGALPRAARLQPLPTPVDGSQKLVQVRLEGLQYLVGVILRSQADLPFSRFGGMYYLLRLALRPFDHFLLASDASSFVTGAPLIV